MVKWPKIIDLALLSSLALAVSWVPAPYAATSATTDILVNDGPGEVGDTVDIGSLKPLAKPNREGGNPLPRGNPLWAVPLSVLTATQERPIFSASRRPPQRAVVAAPVEQASVPALPTAAEPERPPLTLIGAAIGDGDAIAVFLDRTNQKIVRLRLGETHAGWVLVLVLRREVAFEKAGQTELLALQRPGGAAGVVGAPAAPGLPLPASGSVDVSVRVSGAER